MTKIADIRPRIEELLTQGVDPARVAKMLQVPTRWVFHTLDTMDTGQDDVDSLNPDRTNI